MDELTLKSSRFNDVWLKTDKDGDLIIEIEDGDSTTIHYIEAANVPKIRDWLVAALAHSASALQENKDGR